MKGMFATSKAGHDKGKLYIIMEEEDEYVYLSDGRLRTVDKLKKKKKIFKKLIIKKKNLFMQNLVFYINMISSGRKIMIWLVGFILMVQI